MKQYRKMERCKLSGVGRTAYVLKSEVEKLTDTMDKVLFIDIFGMEHIPKRKFKDLDDAQQYANEHELKVVRKLSKSIDKYKAKSEVEE